MGGRLKAGNSRLLRRGKGPKPLTWGWGSQPWAGQPSVQQEEAGQCPAPEFSISRSLGNMGTGSSFHHQVTKESVNSKFITWNLLDHVCMFWSHLAVCASNYQFEKAKYSLCRQIIWMSVRQQSETFLQTGCHAHGDQTPRSEYPEPLQVAVITFSLTQKTIPATERSAN